jgi:inorganic pyrophosphatase
MRRIVILSTLALGAVVLPVTAASAGTPVQHEICLVTYGAGPQAVQTDDHPKDFCINW